jgi:hypothetical protein
MPAKRVQLQHDFKREEREEAPVTFHVKGYEDGVDDDEHVEYVSEDPGNRQHKRHSVDFTSERNWSKQTNALEIHKYHTGLIFLGVVGRIVVSTERFTSFRKLLTFIHLELMADTDDHFGITELECL